MKERKMAPKRYIIDCTKKGPVGCNLTEQPLDNLKPYLWRLDFEGDGENVSIDASDPPEAGFKVINMTDVKFEDFDRENTTIFFKATVEFDLDFDPNEKYGGKYYEKIISEANSMVHVSSDTMGLETSDGVRDNDSFDGLYDAVTVPLQET